MHATMPAVWLAGRRTYGAAVDALPVLAACPDELPDRELSGAATVLRVLAHAYVHQSAGAGSRRPQVSPPRGLR